MLFQIKLSSHFLCRQKQPKSVAQGLERSNYLSIKEGGRSSIYQKKMSRFEAHGLWAGVAGRQAALAGCVEDIPKYVSK